MFLKRRTRKKKRTKKNTLGTTHENTICGCITDALTRKEGREGDGVMEGWEKTRGKEKREAASGRMWAGREQDGRDGFGGG